MKKIIYLFENENSNISQSFKYFETKNVQIEYVKTLDSLKKSCKGNPVDLFLIDSAKGFGPTQWVFEMEKQLKLVKTPIIIFNFELFELIQRTHGKKYQVKYLFPEIDKVQLGQRIEFVGKRPKWKLFDEVNRQIKAGGSKVSVKVKAEITKLSEAGVTFISDIKISAKDSIQMHSKLFEDIGIVKPVVKGNWEQAILQWDTKGDPDNKNVKVNEVVLLGLTDTELGKIRKWINAEMVRRARGGDDEHEES